MSTLGGAEPAATGGNSGAAGGAVTPPPATGTGTGGTPPPAAGQLTGNTTGTWRDSLPEDIRGNATLSKYSDVTNLAKAYLSAQEMIGKKGIIRPADNALPEEWQAFYESMGVPKADQYKIDPSKFKDVEFPKESVEWAQQFGAKHGIRPDQMTALMQDFAQFEIARDNGVESEIKAIASEQMNTLKSEWGDHFDGNLKKGLVAFNHLVELSGLEKNEAMEWLNSGQGDDVVIIRLMAAASKLMGEDTLRENGVNGGAQTMDDISRQIEEVQGHMLAMPKSDPRRQSLVDRYASLNRQRTGGR